MANHSGFTIWFTGLSGAGKTTLGKKIEKILLKRGMNVELLDGDVVRTNLSKGLGFSKEDRDTNIRRIGFVSSLLARNNTVCIAAAISPYQVIRDEVRGMHENFIEVYTECSIEKLEERDTKGLYKKARAGEIKGFTGIDDPYEAPTNPEVEVHTENEGIDESVDKIIRYLELKGLAPAADDGGISAEEEEQIKGRLKSLNFID
ncbi:MAG: adenylyl-sulfate kinase [Planctomycetota bacterium]|jgi:adenylylsulfate kinase|nr:adenylyl-sulfate kinase [Planctomycetota bacterium]